MSEPYQVAVEAMENRQARVTITIPEALADPVLRKTARRVAGEIRIAGFRPGKAPYEVIVRRVGREALVQESLDALFDLAYTDAIAQSELAPSGRPSLSDYTAEPISLTLVVPLQPVADLGDYRSNLRIPMPQVIIADEDVDKLVDEMRDQRSAWSPVDRPAQFGDMVTVDISGMAGEDQVIQREGWDIELSDTDDGLVPGLNAAFVGMAIGETKSFVLTYPDSSTSQWAGHAVEFNTTMQGVKAKVAPTDEELAQEAGDFPDYAALRAHLRGNLEEERRGQAETDYRHAVLEAVVANAVTLDFPLQLVEDEQARMLEEYKDEYRNLGLDFESYLRYTQQTAEQVSEGLRPMAEGR
ncbi:MAG: trigger factor, partial [Anaerolineae bacterium]